MSHISEYASDGLSAEKALAMYETLCCLFGRGNKAPVHTPGMERAPFGQGHWLHCPSGAPFRCPSPSEKLVADILQPRKDILQSRKDILQPGESLYHIDAIKYGKIMEPKIRELHAGVMCNAHVGFRCQESDFAVDKGHVHRKMV